MNIALGHSQDPPSPETLEPHISRAAKALLARQHEDGHWCFELEADATIPAEYVLLRHFRGEKPDLELERLIAVYLRRVQGDHGGWPLVHAGPFDMSASVKAYFALKMIGDDPEAPHMLRARDAILGNGGAASSTRPFRGAECRPCRSRSCSCRAGFLSISIRCPIGRVP
jgi:squalene-hopene/tetraprenyl-beta-curcumene cyclase